MSKSILLLVCIIISPLMMSGCVGYLSYLPSECNNETPSTNASVFDHDYTKIRSISHNITLNVYKIDHPPLSSVSTKKDFIELWGKPDVINPTSDNTETWIYKRHLWCGAIPAFILPVPLVLPVCDGYERIEFQNDNVVNLHIRRTVTGGFLITFIPPFFLQPAPHPSCP